MNNRRFEQFFKQFKKLSKKQIVKIFYDYIGKDKENEKKRRTKRKI